MLPLNKLPDLTNCVRKLHVSDQFCSYPQLIPPDQTLLLRKAICLRRRSFARLTSVEHIRAWRMLVASLWDSFPHSKIACQFSTNIIIIYCFKRIVNLGIIIYILFDKCVHDNPNRAITCFRTPQYSRSLNILWLYETNAHKLDRHLVAYMKRLQTWSLFALNLLFHLLFNSVPFHFIE